MQRATVRDTISCRLPKGTIKGTGRITNSEYQEITGGIRKTAARDLDDLVGKGIFARLGEKRGSYYILAGKK